MEAGLIYNNPTRRLLQKGSFSYLPKLLESFHPRKVLLVLGERSFRSSPYFSRLMEMLEPYEIRLSMPIPQNPTQRFVEEELKRLKTEASDIDIVLAIGGGSVIDVSKLFAAFLKNGSLLTRFLEGNVELEEEPVPLIAVPTTAGTGSEVTPYVSLEMPGPKKVTLEHYFFYPRAALIDPELTYSMPRYITASTGFDALSQAIESFWSVRATPFSRTHAIHALEMMAGSLEQVIRDPEDADARFRMSFGSCEAGLAIAETRTTAVHSVSYPITSHFRVAHGHACALTLSSFVRFNAPVLKEEGRPLIHVFKVSSYEEMAVKVERLMESVGLQRKLSSLKVPKEGLELIVRDGFRPDRIKNNPREVTADALRNILNQIF